MTLAEALHGEADGGRVVGEIVDDLDAVDLALELLAAGHAVEGLEPGADFIGREAGEGCGGGGHGCVADVELAGHAQRVSRAAECERTTVGLVVHGFDAERAVLAEADGGDRAGGFFRDIEAVLLVAIDEGHAAARDDVEQPAEGEFDFVEVVINVRVVELDVVHDDAFREVVEELRTLVEEGGVILVALEDVEFRVGEMRAVTEVFRQPADHVAGIAARVFEDPREHRGGGGLAVGAGDHEVAFPAEEEFLHHLGQGMVEQLAVERGLGLGISPGNGVADDDDVRVGGDVRLGVALGEGDALAAEELGHRRIDIGVGASDGKATLFHGGGDGTHGGATDAGEVKAGLVGHGRARR